MNRLLTRSISVVMYGIAASCVAQTALGGSERGPDAQVSGQTPPPAAPPAAPPKAAKPDINKYPGFAALVHENREAFVTMAKKRLELKGQTPPQDKTFKEYRALEEVYQKVSSRVSEYLSQKRWTDDDRAAMTTILTDELSKPFA